MSLSPQDRHISAVLSVLHGDSKRPAEIESSRCRLCRRCFYFLDDGVCLDCKGMNHANDRPPTETVQGHLPTTAKRCAALTVV